MSRASTFLATSSVTGHTPVMVGGRALLRDHASFRAALRERAPDLERFLAEPLFSGTAREGLGNVSWYSSFEQSSSTLSELGERRREQVLRTLAERLGQAFALIDDPEVGESVRAMLIVPSHESVRVVGVEPVLIDWSVAPSGVGSSSDALHAHFDSVYQPLCGVSWPRQGTDSGKLLPAAMAVRAAGETDRISGSPDEAGRVVDSSTPIAPAHVQADEGGDRSSVGSAAALAVPVLAVPWYRRRPVGVFLALLLTGLILFILWWLLFAPGGLLSRGLPGGYPHESIVDSLRDERDRLRDLNEMACGPELIESVRDGFSGPLAVPPLAGGVDGEGAPDGAPGSEREPGPVAPSDGIPQGTQGVVGGSSLTALAQRLERSVVLVVGAGAGGVGMGTGFFIGPDLLVTNRHVVENVDPARVIVTSEFLGTVRPVRVVSMTSNSEIGRPDFAVLQLQGGPAEGVVPLSIRESAPKLARVVTAGFPAYIARSDPQLTALLGGDAQAAPSMVFTSGEVSVVQGQRTGTEIIIHTADMSQGSSGGPLVDACGRVAGVNTFIGTDDASGRRGLYSLAGSGLMSFLISKGVVFSRADSVCADGGEVAAAGE